MAMSAGGTTNLNSDINVTPMVDIMLVLLIIFMVVTPLLQTGVTVTLPKGKTPWKTPISPRIRQSSFRFPTTVNFMSAVTSFRGKTN